MATTGGKGGINQHKAMAMGKDQQSVPSKPKFRQGGAVCTPTTMPAKNVPGRRTKK